MLSTLLQMNVVEEIKEVCVLNNHGLQQVYSLIYRISKNIYSGEISQTFQTGGGGIEQDYVTNNEDRFEADEKALSELQGTNSVPSYECHQTNSACIIKLKTKKAITLKELVEWYMPPLLMIKNKPVIDYSGTIPVRVIRKVFMGMVNSARAMHSKGIEHCNLNPKTILFNSDGSVNFYCFWYLHKDGKRVLGSHGSKYGYDEYWDLIIPELQGSIKATYGTKSRGKLEYKGLNRAGDIFALGCLLYYLCFGVFPFAGKVGRNSRYKRFVEQAIKNHDFEEFWEGVEEETKAFFEAQPEEERDQLKDLLNGMFQQRGANITLADVKCHEWLSESKVADDFELMKAFEKVRTYYYG